MSPTPSAPPAGVRATCVARISHIVRDAPPEVVGDIPAHALPQLRPPLVAGDLGSFGGHRVLRMLGRGGMGAVYEAIDSALGRTIAMKLMLPAQAASEAGRQRFVREARASAAIRHENVVTIYNVGEDAGIPFLTMEFLRGQPLGQLLVTPMPPGEIVRIGREVARGLAAAHAMGVVHRDIKPENVWIEEGTGRVRLLDFGLARLGADVPDDPLSDPFTDPVPLGLTQVGAIIGTPAYMAPEQARGETVDHKADLFSLGCVLYQMLTGAFPFRGQTVRDQIQALTAGAYVPIDPGLGVPADLADLVHRLLAAPPSDRPANAAAVADELLTVGTRMLVRAGAATPMPVGELSRQASGAPAFEIAEPAPVVPQQRSQVPLLLATICLVVLVTVLLSTQRMHRESLARQRAAQQSLPTAQARTPAPPPRQGQGWLSAGFTPLFAGNDLSGWHASGGGRSDAWGVSGEILRGRPVAGGDQILLSDAQYGDFELVLEYRWTSRGGHTSLLLRAADGEAQPYDGVPINIGDDEGFPTRHGRPIGRLYETGTVRHVTFDPPPANKPLGEWNALRVVARGSAFEVELNGVKMPTADLAAEAELLATKPWYARPRGSLGLVCHWGAIEYRRVAVRALP